jgi:hypothetical protein
MKVRMFTTAVEQERARWTYLHRLYVGIRAEIFISDLAGPRASLFKVLYLPLQMGGHRGIV